MICPNCRSEVGNQPICPYCGKSLPLQRGASMGSFTVQVPPVARSAESYSAGGKQSVASALRRMNRQLAAVDLRSKLCLVLTVGIFVMQLIILIVLAGK